MDPHAVHLIDHPIDMVESTLPATFRRGVTLTTAGTYGHGSTSDLGPTSGNRFDEFYERDLTLLARLDVTDLRLTFDWPRLQPTPGRIDDFWAEHVDQVLDTATELDLRVWATLHDGAVPRWFDDEGGTGDDVALVRRWPHWVEGVADRFGDRVHGWVPFAGIARDMPMMPWTDTWGILRGSSSRVVASMAVDHVDRVERFFGSCDALGLTLHAPADGADEIGNAPTRDQLDRVTERISTDLHRFADAADDVAVLISQYTAHHDDLDVAGELMVAAVLAADEAIGDGIDLDVVFADPAIQVPSTALGLLGTDRDVLPAGEAFFRPGVGS